MDNSVLKNQVGQILGLIVEVTNIYSLLVKILKNIECCIAQYTQSPEICYFLKAFSFIIVILPVILENFRCLGRTTLSRKQIASFHSFGET